MKSKHSLISLVLGIVIIGLSVIVLVGKGSGGFLMPLMLICLGLFQIFNGVHFYKLDKKSDGILLISAGVFIFVAAVKIALF